MSVTIGPFRFDFAELPCLPSEGGGTIPNVWVYLAGDERVTGWIGPGGREAWAEFVKAATKHEQALRKIAYFDEFQGMPIAPRETPTTKAMRQIALEAISDE